MKKNFLHNLIFLCLFFSTGLLAQSYTCTIQNQTVNGNNFSFDIYIQRTDATEIYLGESEFSVIFNNGNFTSPTVSRSAGSDLAWYTSGVTIPVGYPNIIKFSLGSLFFNEDQGLFDTRVCKVSTIFPGTLIATITISSQGLNTTGSAGIQWRTTVPHDSKVNNYLNVTPWSLTNITANGIYTNPPDAPLPVELSSFAAEVKAEKIDLIWETKTEINNYGFDVERSLSGDKENRIWNLIGFVKGNGNSNSEKKYSFTDKIPYGGSKFVYRLKQIDNDGKFDYSDEVEVELLPTKYELYQNYPNPFNPSTTIKFSLPKQTQLKINLYNLLGELVTTAAEGLYDGGYHVINLNISNFASGIYLYQLETKDFSNVKKMVLIK